MSGLNEFRELLIVAGLLKLKDWRRMKAMPKQTKVRHVAVAYCQNINLSSRAGINDEEENREQETTSSVMDGKQVGRN